MPRNKKKVDEGAGKAYLLSFGDTMTALCAFFIVLNSLAKEQTGANLHAGTGSFVRSLQSFGIPGIAPGEQSQRVFEMQEMSPLYVVPPPDGQASDVNGDGPDEDPDEIRVIDREQEDFERFLNEVGRFAEVSPVTPARGEVTFDIFNPIGSEPPFMTGALTGTFSEVAMFARNPDYRIQIIVWATTPSQTGWARAARQASGLRSEFGKMAALDRNEVNRVSGLGRPWMFSNVKRPAVSIVVRRLE